MNTPGDHPGVSGAEPVGLDGVAADRFVWPPRRVMPDPKTATAATLPSARPDNHPALSVPAASPPGTPPFPAQGPLSFLWAEVERTWLDITAPPLDRRVRELGWTPDVPDRYCPRCARSAGPYEVDDGGCSGCRGRRLPWDRLVRLGEYRPPLSTFVQEVKFTRWRRLGIDLGKLLGTALRQAMDEHPPPCPGPPVIVPVPTTFWRRAARGIDHTRVIARAVAGVTGGRVAQALKRDHRPSQRSVPASRRAANVARSIYLKKGQELQGRFIVLVDDVTTTGATLRAAARALQGTAGIGGEKPLIWCAVLGWTPVPGERRESPPATPGTDW